MKFSGKVGNGRLNKQLNFGGDPDTVWIQGLIFGFVTMGRYGKVVIRQMAALVRRDLAEVCPGSSRAPQCYWMSYMKWRCVSIGPTPMTFFC